MGKLITKNKKAYHDYQVLDTLEAGIVLTGDEVKSLRAGTVSLIGAYATVHQAELYLINCNITPYQSAYIKPADSTQRRKLLLHRRELNRLIGDISKKGITIVPLSLYFNDRNLAKVEIGICKHKKAVDKKNVLKERDIKREMARDIRGR
jgi:SsrA-binding protein